MKKAIVLSLGFFIACVFTVSGQVSNVNFNADDLIPAIAGGPAEIVKPDAVKVEEDKSLDEKEKVVVADSAQDAVNAAIKENMSGDRDITCTCVKFPSGMG